MMIVGLIIIFGIVILIDLHDLLNSDQRLKAGLIYVVLLGSGFIISFLQLIDRAPTSPAIVIENLINILLGR